MNKTTKGAFAASAAAVLLLGGVGSLAYWNDSADVAGGAINSGNLALDSDDCAEAGWTVSNSVEGVSAVAFDIATENIVPGDVLTKTCEVTVEADGTNLRAKLGVTGGGSAASTMAASAYDLDSEFLLGGAALDEVTEANDGDTVDATITLTFPLGTAVDNNSKDKVIDLDDFTVAATQATQA